MTIRLIHKRKLPPKWTMFVGTKIVIASHYGRSTASLIKAKTQFNTPIVWNIRTLNYVDYYKSELLCFKERHYDNTEIVKSLRQPYDTHFAIQYIKKWCNAFMIQFVNNKFMYIEE